MKPSLLILQMLLLLIVLEIALVLFLQVPGSIALSSEAALDPSDSLCEEPEFDSHTLTAEVTCQSKQSCVLAQPFDLPLSVPRRADRQQILSTLSLPSTLFFVPRKLSPPSTDGASFLN
jgi:hypothetical protein